MGRVTGLTGHHRRHASVSLATELIAGDDRIVRRVSEPARQAVWAPELPARLHRDVRDVLARGGIERLYAFQHAAAELILAGQHVALSGATGTGKSLCYQLPILQQLRVRGGQGAQRKHTALYLSPTKALAQDQARRLRDLGARWARPQLYDGDTASNARAQIRRSASLLLTNPDMLSAGILPRHAQWSSFFAGLDIVVIDEAHVYRGVFGSHVAHVLRRLRRIACAHRPPDAREPVFVCASGTMADPVRHMHDLVGVEAEHVGDLGAPRSGRDILLYNPELDDDSGERDSAIGDAARMYAQLIEGGSSVIVFARTRRACELIHRFARERIERGEQPDLADMIAPYRAGYTAQQRRETERDLANGELRGVVATSALELGIDIGSLEVSIATTFPGTVTSLRQQWGRAGRGDVRGCCVLIAGDDALDQYFMQHPDALLERPIEQAIISTDNRRILVPHLAAASAELPIAGPLDDALWPSAARDESLGELRAQGAVVDSGAGTVYTGRDQPAAGIALRSSGRGDVVIVDADTGEVLGTVEVGRAINSVYPGAVYLHRGAEYLIEQLDTNTLVAHARACRLPYYTMPRIDTDIRVLGVANQRTLPSGVKLYFGSIIVEEQLTGYQRIRTDTHEVIDVVDEHLPPLDFDTEAVWFQPPRATLDELEGTEAAGAMGMLGALHAAEHGLIALLPLLAMCDRWDIGGLSIDWHDAFSGPGIFVYDGVAGGIGIANAGFDRFESWARAALDVIRNCPCESGCPSCVQSPKCGNLNEPLNKLGAIDALHATLRGSDTDT